MLVEVHILQNHAPGNLNRDDTGSPKEAVFGGYKRARISSQCLKRSYRRSEIFKSKMENSLGCRTRRLPELVRERLKKAGIDEKMAGIAAKKVSGFGNKEGREQSPSAEGYYKTAQTVFLSDQDVQAVTEVLLSAARKAETSEKFEKIKAKDLQKEATDRGFRPIAADIALFGRMVTSEAFVDVEASCQFAHAISTHKVDHEFDYYTAVDDLERALDDEAGAGADMIGDVEFNSACYYKYFNVHVDGLEENLTGAVFGKKVSPEDAEQVREISAKALCALVEAACRVTPSGKQNSFAAHQLPSLLWIEVRDQNLPVSYANAFAVPVNPRTSGGIEGESARKLKEECEALQKMYGLEAKERLLLSKHQDMEILETKPMKNLQGLLQKLEAVVIGRDESRPAS